MNHFEIQGNSSVWVKCEVLFPDAIISELRTVSGPKLPGHCKFECIYADRPRT